MPPYSRKMLKRKYKSTNYVPAKRYRPTVIRATKGEIKSKDVGVTAAFTTTGVVTLLNGVAQGSNITERDGRIIHPNHLQCQLFLFPNGNITQTAFTIYFIYDMAPNGVLPTFTEMFATASFVTVPRQDQSWRFKILKKVLWTPTYDTTNKFVDSDTKHMDFKINLKGKVVNYISTSDGIADIGKGAIYMVTIGGNLLGSYNLYSGFRFNE